MAVRTTIVYVITHLAVGGAQKVVLSLAEGLDRDKFDVWLLTGPGGGWQARAKRALGDRKIVLPSLVREISPAKDAKSVFEIVSRLKRIKKLNPEAPLIVHSHAPKAGVAAAMACRLTDTQHIHTVHGWPFFEQQSALAYKLYKSFASLTFSAPKTKVISVAESNIQIGIDNGWFKADDVVVIPPCTEIGELRPRKGSRKLLGAYGVKESEYAIGMIAAFKSPKDHMTLVKAAGLLKSRIPNFKLIFAGDGETKSAVKKELRKYGLLDNSVFLGWYDDVARLMPDLDVLVLPSLAEGLPLVLVEARACGVPSISCPVYGVKEVVEDDKTGLFLKPGDYEELADKIELLLEDKKTASRIVSDGLKGLYRYSLQSVVEEHERFYLE